MAYDEFVDLDEIVPGTGFRKKPEEPAQKKDRSKIQEETTELSSPSPEKQKPKVSVKRAEVEESEYEETEESVKSIQKEKQEQKENVPEEKKQKEESIKEEKQKPVQDKKPVHKIQKQEARQETVRVEKKAEKSSLKNIISNSKKKKMQDRESKVEKRTHHSQKKSASKSSEKNETNWVVVALIILAAIVVGVIIYMALKFDFSGSNQESIVAVVNGEPIYKSEISNRYNLLTSTLDPLISEEQVLNLTITDKLLLQEAAKKGIKTSDEEVSSLLNDIMLQNNIDEESLKQDLEAKNVSFDFLISLYKNTLTVNKLINQSFSNMTISDKELEEFYNSNKESLTVPDMVQVRHILIMYGLNSENDTYAKAENVLKLINENKSNFCSLVTAYSEDTGSIETCGEYNFSSDYLFVPEFLEAGFTMNPGEIKIVKTQIGYHIMYKIANLPSFVPPLNEIKTQLSAVISEEKALTGLQNMITDLQSKAIIEIYNDNISTKRFKELTADQNQQKTNNEQEESEEDIVKEEIPAIIETKESSDSQESVVTKEVLNTPSSQKFLLATCLADNGYRMFTASWSPDSKAQLDLFEEYALYLSVVECDPDSNTANLKECADVLKKQYPTWPTWEIEGDLYEGVQSLAALSRYSGCPYQG